MFFIAIRQTQNAEMLDDPVNAAGAGPRLVHPALDDAPDDEDGDDNARPPTRFVG